MGNLQITKRIELYAIFLLSGLIVFVAPDFLSNEKKIVFQITVAVVLFLLSVWLRGNKGIDGFFQVVFALFIGSFVTLLESLVQIYGLASTLTVEGSLLYQIASTIVIVVPIVLLTKFSGNSLGSIYLQKGRLKLGLLIGLGTLLFFVSLMLAFPTGASMLFTIRENITREEVLYLMPYAVGFVVLNGFKEELWYRGIFLRKYEAFFGAWPSNILATFVFAVAHVGVGYTPVLVIFLGITFILGLVWGYVMQKTDSIIGAALFHGAMDIAIILGIFSFM